MPPSDRTKTACAAISGLVGIQIAGPVGLRFGAALGELGYVFGGTAAETIVKAAGVGTVAAVAALLPGALTDQVKGIRESQRQRLNHDIQRACTRAIAACLRHEAGGKHAELTSFWAAGLQEASGDPERFALIYPHAQEFDAAGALWEQEVLRRLGDPVAEDVLLWQDVSDFLLRLPEEPTLCGPNWWQIDLALEARAAARIPAAERREWVEHLKTPVLQGMRRAYAGVIAADPIARDKTAFYLTQYLAAESAAQGRTLTGIDAKVDVLIAKFKELADGSSREAFVSLLAGTPSVEIQALLSPAFDEILSALVRIEAQTTQILTAQHDDRRLIEGLMNQIAGLSGQITALLAASATSQAQVAEGQTQIVGYQAQISELVQKYETVLARGNVEETPLERALVALASNRLDDATRLFRLVDPKIDDNAIRYHRGQGDLAMRQHRYTIAESEYEKAWVLDKSDLEILRALMIAVYRGEDPRRAITFAQDLHAKLQSQRGDRHPDTLTSMNNLAGTYGRMGRNEEALALEEETLAARREVQGERHPDTLTSMNNLALNYWTMNRKPEAFVLLETTLLLRTEVLGPTHPDTLQSQRNLDAARNSGN